MQPSQSIFTGKNVIFLSETHSTNTDAMDLLSKTKPPEGTCIMTDFQAVGRGQIGRTWQSERGKNLLVSYIFYPKQLNAIDQFYLNMVASLALVSTMAKLDIAVKIKWPNDIYYNDYKLTGILIQNVLYGSTIKSTVIGIGLNVNQTDFSSLLPNPISIANITKATHDLQEIFNLLSSQLEYYYQLLQAKKYNNLSNLYHEHLYRIHQKSQFSEPEGETFYGSIEGVTPDGRLTIEKENGIKQSYMLKDVIHII